MPLRRFLAKLMDATSSKEVEAVKTPIASTLSDLSKSSRDAKELHTAISQLLDFYISKHAEFIVDIVASLPETVAQEFLRHFSERILFVHKELVTYSSGQTVSISQANKYFESLCSLLEFMLKVVSRGPWWNQLVISSLSAAFSDIIKDPAVDVSCYMAIVYTLSICIPYSIAYLDERVMLWLCHITNTLLCRAFGDGIKAVAPQLTDDALKGSIMQLVLILYGIFPITFLKQLMQSCPGEVVDYVVSQLRLHPILSQHLGTQRSEFPAITPGSSSSAAVAGSSVLGGMSQAECKSKNRFRGKDFSDIVTECLNYEATSPPKMFSADGPPASILASGLGVASPSTEIMNLTADDTSQRRQAYLSKPSISAENTDHLIFGAIDNNLYRRSLLSPTAEHGEQNGQAKKLSNADLNNLICKESLKHRLPDWCHETARHKCFYSCPGSPLSSSPISTSTTSCADSTKKLSEIVASSQHVDLVSLPTKPVLSTARRSLSRVNESIRTMLSEHRQRLPPNEQIEIRSGGGSFTAAKCLSFDSTQPQQTPRQIPRNLETSNRDAVTDVGSAIPTQYVKCYIKLQQLKSEGLPESELLREQLRLAQLSLAFERHRQLIFICKNRSLMAEHKKSGELDGYLEELKKRIRELEIKLEMETEKRSHAEQRVVHLLQTQSGLTVSVNANSGGTDFLLADLSPRYRHKTGPASMTLGSALLLEPGASGVTEPPPTPVAGAMPRASSASEFFANETSVQSLAISTANASLSSTVTTLTSTTTTTTTTGSLMKRDYDELMRQKEDLSTELGILRQQLRQAQLEALSACSSGGSQAASGEGEGRKESSGDDVDRLELLTQQLNDSRREVSALGELMAEMKARLDVAESDRRKLAVELSRISTYGSSNGMAHTMSLPVSSQLANAIDARLPSSSSSASNNNPRLEQYPTLKRQVEKILLRKQELATSSSTVAPSSSNSSSSQQQQQQQQQQLHS